MSTEDVLHNFNPKAQLLVADLGIPKAVYDEFGVTTLPFDEGGIH